MKIIVLSAFPNFVSQAIDWSIVKRARDKGVVEIDCVDLREYGEGKYKAIDDRPYGGGAGMLYRVDVIDKALNEARQRMGKLSSRVVLLDAGGKTFTQKLAQNYAKLEGLILICGHYEGVDHRVHEYLAQDVVSIGNYVVSGGEMPALIIVDSVTRLIPGAIGNQNSLALESHNTLGEREYPQYTRPMVYRGWKVPEVLVSGDHREIEKWRSALDE